MWFGFFGHIYAGKRIHTMYNKYPKDSQYGVNACVHVQARILEKWISQPYYCSQLRKDNKTTKLYIHEFDIRMCLIY
jgi:hypothetical protein